MFVYPDFIGPTVVGSMEREVRQAEEFVNTRLLPDLKRVSSLVGRVESDIENYKNLIKQLDDMSGASLGKPTTIQLTSTISADFTFEEQDFDKVLVNVGKDVFVEFDLLEAFRFCHEKIYYLQRKRDLLNDRQETIQQHLQDTTHSLQMLLDSLQHQHPETPS